MHPWSPVYTAMSVAAERLWPPRTGSQGSQVVTADPQVQTAAQARGQEILAEFREGFRQVTPTLILTGIAIGIATGIGSTVGTAIGSYFVGLVQARRKRLAR